MPTSETYSQQRIKLLNFVRNPPLKQQNKIHQCKWLLITSATQRKSIRDKIKKIIQSQEDRNININTQSNQTRPFIRPRNISLQGVISNFTRTTSENSHFDVRVKAFSVTWCPSQRLLKVDILKPHFYEQTLFVNEQWRTLTQIFRDSRACIFL